MSNANAPLERGMTPAALRALLHYDPETGEFTWVAYRQGIYAGKVAGSPGTKGYLRIRIGMDDRRHEFKAHHLAWLWVYGEWPTVEIDHKDGNKLNNAISNLRLATTSQNQGNRKRPSTNSTGYKGVSRQDRWYRAKITHNGVKHNLGLFKTPEEAYAVYCAKAKELFGEFARVA
jgi:hypothetical protein